MFCLSFLLFFDPCKIIIHNFIVFPSFSFCILLRLLQFFNSIFDIHLFHCNLLDRLKTWISSKYVYFLAQQQNQTVDVYRRRNAIRIIGERKERKRKQSLHPFRYQVVCIDRYNQLHVFLYRNTRIHIPLYR